MMHDLKTWPEYFAPVIEGSKTFEIRKNDRPFACGDNLNLREYDPDAGEYTGRTVLVSVTYLLSDGPFCVQGHVVMAIRL